MRTNRYGTLVFLATAACSTGADAVSGVDEGATVIEPSGTDAPGKLRIVAPAGNLEPVTITRPGSNATFALGQVIDAVPVGSAPFSISAQGATLSLHLTDAARVTSGQTKTVNAALLAPRAVGGPRTLGLGADVTGAIQLHAPGAYAPRQVQGAVQPTADGTKSVPVLAGSYEINFGIHGVDGVPVTLAEGETKVVTLSDPAGRRVTRIKAPTRLLPNATCGAAGDGKNVTLSVQSAYGAAAQVALGDGAELDVGVAPSKEGTSYAMNHVAWAEAVSIPLGQRGAGPLKWELGRIDVTDVKVNGTATARGTYRIFPFTAQGAPTEQNFLRCAAETSSGVDVPPGKYRVEVRYRTVESGDKIDEHVVTVP